MATDNAEGKEKQREYVIQKDNILSLQAPTLHASLAIRQGVFLYHVTIFCVFFDKKVRTAGTVPCIKL